MDTQSYAYTKIHLTIYFTSVTCVNLNKAVKKYTEINSIAMQITN